MKHLKLFEDFLNEFQSADGTPTPTTTVGGKLLWRRDQKIHVVFAEGDISLNGVNLTLSNDFEVVGNTFTNNDYVDLWTDDRKRVVTIPIDLLRQRLAEA